MTGVENRPKSEGLQELIHYLRTVLESGRAFVQGETYTLGDTVRVTVRPIGDQTRAGMAVFISSPADTFRRPLVAVMVGSASDMERMQSCVETLQALEIPHEVVVLSAHRTPDDTVTYVRTAERRGVRVFICAAGMAAHLPGVVAAHTDRPVIGVPIASGILSGLDALLSITQMPPGVPVAGVGVDGGRNAALLAARILQLELPWIADRLRQYHDRQRERTLAHNPWVRELERTVVRETHIPELSLIKRGKVRDIYDLGDRMLIVATDRISVFDVVLPTPVPGKGKILTAISVFWFWKFQDRVRHHLISTRATDLPNDLAQKYPYLDGRVMIVRKLRVIPIECIVRGYLAGSGWRMYRETGRIMDVELPPGLREGERLPEPIFTPTTKATEGHDRPMTFQEVVDMVGTDVAVQLRDLSLMIYREAAAYAEQRGLIIADTKFEFGMDDAGQIYLIDELLTPDSSRFWDRQAYAPGRVPPNFDKQYVRDYTSSLGWNKQPPGPSLPPDVVARTIEIYLEALRRLIPFADTTGIV